MARRNRPRKLTYFEPVLPRLARNTVIESTFEVGRRFQCTMRVDCSQLEPARCCGRYRASGTRICPRNSTRRNLPTGVPAALRSISWRP